MNFFTNQFRTDQNVPQLLPTLCQTVTCVEKNPAVVLHFGCTVVSQAIVQSLSAYKVHTSRVFPLQWCTLCSFLRTSTVHLYCERLSTMHYSTIVDKHHVPPSADSNLYKDL